MTRTIAVENSSHDHHHHHHSHGATLWRALLLTFAFAIVEAVTGWWSGSLALMSDAGHMFSDSSALALAALAAWIAHRPPSARHSYGFARAEVIAALLNSVAMLLVIIWIAVEAVSRLRHPMPVAGVPVMAVAALGLMVNLAVAFVLQRGEHNINTRAALLHVMGDLLGSLAALAAGVVIYFTNWTLIDPILSLLVAALILFSSLNLLREALHVLMEGVPLEIDLEEVGQALARQQGVCSVHDLHIWTLSSGKVALSAHMELDNINGWSQLLESTRHMLHERFDIDHVTLQPEVARVIQQPYKAAIRIIQK